MKTFLYCVLFLGLFASCKGIDPTGDAGVLPVSASEDVEFFFESHLPPSDYSHSNTSFNFGEETECFVHWCVCVL